MFDKYHILTVFIVFSLFFGGGFDSFFGQIRDDEPVESGQTLEYHVNVVNHADDDIDDVHVRMFIYDLGEMIVANTFDVDDLDSAGKFLLWETEGVEPGEYLARITLSNDDFREVKHRYITIV
jgi:hypothetical protein|tara:strand:+ start:89 stop:457 length:369 start_codon:yes stop_codon:yes gene_type:complete